MKHTLAYGAALAQGSWPCQEDGYYLDPGRGLAAVADGFGGRGAGDLAAKLALAELRAPTAAELGAAEEGSPVVRRLSALAARANKQILQRNEPRPPSGRGGASFLAAEISHGVATLVHTGACAAWLARGGALVPVLVPQAEPRRDFTPLLPREALGLGERLSLETRALRLQSGDLLFLASSGLDLESAAFQSSLLALASARAPGAALEPLCAQLVEQAGLSAQGWNRTLLAFEAP